MVLVFYFHRHNTQLHYRTRNAGQQLTMAILVGLHQLDYRRAGWFRALANHKGDVWNYANYVLQTLIQAIPAEWSRSILRSLWKTRRKIWPKISQLMYADVYSASNASAALREDFRVLWQNWSAKLLRWSSSIAIFYEHWCSSWIAHVTINSDCGSWAFIYYMGFFWGWETSCQNSN